MLAMMKLGIFGQLNIGSGEFLLLGAFSLIPIAALWFIVKTAVLSALRQHDRELNASAPPRIGDRG